jgi:predicted dehydrogenase
LIKVKFGIIGFGSIGKRHAENLLALGFDDTVLLRNQGSGNLLGLNEVSTIDAFFESGVDQVILSNPTSMHMSYLRAMLARNINVLAEKPLLSDAHDIPEFESLMASYSGKGMVAFNMRYHPCIKDIFQILRDKELGSLYSARFYVGQYLPDWRPERDYTRTYSAQKALGGGVTLDLIHEIDLALYLVGQPGDRFHAIADHVSDLRVDTEDLVEILYQTPSKCMVTIHLDYLTRGYRRDIQFMGERGYLEVDLSAAMLEIIDSTGMVIRSHSYPDFQRNDMHMDLLKSYIKYIEQDSEMTPNFYDGLLANKIAFKAREDFYHAS